MSATTGRIAVRPVAAPATATSSAPRLSIIIVTYNCRSLAEACLRSLRPELAGLGAGSWELIVVDNGSGDGTVEMLRAHPLGVRVLEAQGNDGFAAANNRGLRIARGDRILLLNPDTEVSRGTLERALEQMDGRPEIGMLGVKLVLEDGSLDHACKRGFPTPRAALGYMLRLDRVLPSGLGFGSYRLDSADPDREVLVDAISGAFMLVRRAAVNDVGPLDEGYWMYSEDLDWCARFHNAGWKVLYWPGTEVLHLKGGSGGHRSIRTNVAFHRGMIRFHRLHGGTSSGVNCLVAGAVWLRLGLSLASGWLRKAARTAPIAGRWAARGRHERCR